LSYLANTQTDKQTNKQTNKNRQKHNLLGGGNKAHLQLYPHFCCYCFQWVKICACFSVKFVSKRSKMRLLDGLSSSESENVKV